MHHITAKIKLSENFSRPHTNNGIKSGYMPHHKFSGVEGIFSGKHQYSDENYHFPGEELTVKIGFPSWENLQGRLQIGDTFELRELNALVGFGEILSIQN
ncbi:hypothetical protein [Acidovorax sp.]|uniref:hypothetical protein n=1 Tax=Acidovorax sp. TaxID=1872122 RepID=UPI00391A0560